MDALHLTTAHTPTDTRIFDKEAKTLAEAGLDVGIVAHDTPDRRRDGVRFVSLGEPETRVERWRSIPKTASLAKRIGANVYHIHDPELLPVAVYLSEVSDAAVVYDVHEDFGHVAGTREWIPDSVGTLLATTVPFVERNAVKRLDAVVVVSDWIGALFQGIVDELNVVHNFPRTSLLLDVDGDVETSAEVTMCYVGGLEDVRGIHEMLELVEYLRETGTDVELWAVGPWKPDADRERAMAHVEANDLHDHVRFTGEVQYEEMFRYLQSADVGVALLDTTHCVNGIPTKYFEYLYAGLPVVTTPIDAVTRFLPPEYRYVTPENDVPGAAEAVRRAADADYDTSAMREIVESQYSWEREAWTLLGLYERLLGRSLIDHTTE